MGGRDRAPRRREFEDLVAPHLDSFLLAARRLTSTDADAEDLSQDALVKAYRAFDRFQPGTNFRAWLVRILANAAIDRFRRRGRSPESFSFDEAFPSKPEAQEINPPLEAAALERFLPDEVLHALDRLRPEHRILIVLRDLQDLSYKEIAEAVGIPIGTVMSRLFHARSALRDELKSYAESEGYLRRTEPEMGRGSETRP